MNKRRNLVVTPIVALALLFAAPAAAQAANVAVSISGGELNIAADSGTALGTQVGYRISGDDWEIIDAFATAGAGCTDESSAIVICPNGGEDIDIDFANSGGFVDLAGTDFIVPFETSITLGSGSDTVDGARGRDVVTAPSLAATSGDTIRTREGNDQVTLAAGSDLVNGGEGDDTINAGGGNNIINGGDFAGDTDGGNDVLVGGSLADTIDGGGGIDTITGGGSPADTADDDDLDGGPGGDVISGGGGEDEIDGGDGNDNLDGQHGNDEVNGGAGNDLLGGGDGNDQLDGGENTSGPVDTDTLFGGPGDDTLLNSDGSDSFSGGSNGSAGDEVDYNVPTTSAVAMTIDIDNVADDGRNCPGIGCEGDNVDGTIERVTGDTAADVITGDGAANVLDGGSGNDTLAGGPGPGGDGADRFIGGSGTDTVTYATRTAPIFADIDGADDDGPDSDEIETDIENLIGGTAADILTGSSAANVLSGGPGTGNDTLNGDSGADTLRGGDGTNSGNDGADTFSGGSGTDTADYGSRSAALSLDLDGSGGDDGAAGEADTLGADIENLIGGSGADDLTGNSAANTLDGGGASDRLAGGTGSGADGADTLIGGGGTADVASYANRTDPIAADLDGAAGDDGASGEADTLGSDIEDLIGGSASDTLTGNNSRNLLMGGPGTGNDTLNGGNEDDRMAGGTGSNTGPDGADTFNAGGQGLLGDTVTYTSRQDNLLIGINFPFNSDGDQINSAVDNLEGGDGNDGLGGDADANRLDGGPGDDQLAPRSGAGPFGADAADTLVGGPGNDTANYLNRGDDLDLDLDGAADDGGSGEGDRIGADIEGLLGGSGDDDLTGSSAANLLNGSGGDDDLDSGTSTGPDGADTYIGGSDGTAGGQNSDRGDRLIAAARTDDLSYDLGGGADDSDGDDLHDDVEQILGGSGDDRLVGDGDANTLDGRQGDDRLSGGQNAGPDGADTFVGGTGADVVDYSPRTDALAIDLNLGTGPDGDDLGGAREAVIGGSGDDTLTGSAGANRLTGGPGSDTVAGLAGADTIDVRDGVVDTVDCGDDTDTVSADSQPADLLTGCETVSAPPPDQPPAPPAPPAPGGGEDPDDPAPPDTPAPPDGPAPPDTDPPARDTDAPRLDASAASKQRSGSRLVLQARCDEACTLDATAKLTVPKPRGRGKKNLRVAPASVELAAGEQTRASLRYPKRTRRTLGKALRKGKRSRATISVRATDAAGNANAAQTFVVKVAKPRR